MKDDCVTIDLVLQKGQPGEARIIGGSCEKKNIDVVALIDRIPKGPISKAQDLRPKQGMFYRASSFSELREGSGGTCSIEHRDVPTCTASQDQ